jgi:hypothetical protein
MKYRLFQFEANYWNLLQYCSINGIEFKYATDGMSLAFAVIDEEQYVFLRLMDSTIIMEPILGNIKNFKKVNNEEI